MNIFLYNFFHNETNDRTEKGLVNIPASRDDWPDSWKTVEYKKYALFKEISLPKEEGALFELLSKRRSSTGCISGNEVTLAKLSSILKCGYGLQDGGGENRKENRTVPSGGMRFPLEVYLFLFKDIDGCRAGIYHYGIRSHALEPVILRQFSEEDLISFSPIGWIKDTQGMVCITSIFGRTARKYGSRGYRYILLEAGHTAQNMLLAGTEHGINMIPVGGINEEVVEKALGLGNLRERVVYTLFF